MTKIEKSAETKVALSTLLEEITVDDRALIVSGFMEQIAGGLIRAVPIADEPLTVEFTGMSGEREQAELPDVLILNTPKVQQWIAAKQRETRYAIMDATRRVKSTPERLATKEDDFDRLAEMYKNHISATLTKPDDSKPARKKPANRKASPNNDAAPTTVTTAKKAPAEADKSSGDKKTHTPSTPAESSDADKAAQTTSTRGASDDNNGAPSGEQALAGIVDGLELPPYMTGAHTPPSPADPDQPNRTKHSTP